MHKVLSLALSIVVLVTSCFGTFGYAASSPTVDEMKVQLGGDSGIWYDTVIDHTNKEIILALPSSLIGQKAVRKAKIAYRATGTLSASSDCVYQDISQNAVFTVNDAGSSEDYTLKVIPLTMQRDYNFNGASLMAANHGTKERRKALGYVANTGSGMWYNFGYAFDSEGNQIEAETFGTMSLQSETSGKSYLIDKTKTGGELGVASIAGEHISSTDYYTFELDFNVQSISAVGSDGVLFTVRTSNTERVAVIKDNSNLKVGYITSDGSLCLNGAESFSTNAFHTLKLTFKKYNTDNYALNIKVDDKLIDTVYSSGSAGKLNSEVVSGSYVYDTVGFQLLTDSDAKLDMKIDNYKLYANKGDEALKDDASANYTYGADALLSAGNLNAPPPPPTTDPDAGEQKPDSPAFDGNLDLGFENGGIGWTLNKVNLIPNSSFEKEEIWSVGSTDHNRTVDYTSDKAYTGSKSVKVEYTDADREKYQAGVRNNTTVTINPYSEYMLGMAVIFHRVGSQNPDDPDDKLNNSNIKAVFDFKRPKNSNGETTEDTTHANVTTEITDWKYVDDYFLSTQSYETFVKDFMPRINGAGVGTYAYFDDIYFGTVSHVINENHDKYSGSAYSGENLLHLGAYNGIHSSDGLDKAESISLSASEYRTYTMKAYAMKKAGNATAKIAIAFFDADGNSLGMTKGSGVTNTDWTETTVTASAPKGTASMKLYLLAEGSGSVAFDHVSYAVEPQNLTSIKGVQNANVLLGATEQKTYTLDAYAADRFGQPIQGFDETFTLVSPVPAGASVTGDILTISSSVPHGATINIKVTAGGLNETYTLTVQRGTLEITGTSAVTRSSTDTDYVYNAYFNSNGTSSLLSGSDVTWSVTGVGSNVVLSDGTLTVGSTTEIGEYKLKAVLNQNTNIYTEYTITVSKQADTVVIAPAGGSPSTPSGSAGGSGGAPAAGQIPPRITTTPVFNDVPTDFWGYEAINYFAEKGYISGDGSGDFKINDSISRAEYIKVLLMIFGIEVKEYDTAFADVSRDAWYYGYVATANALGLVGGIDAVTFAPDAAVTRQDMAVIIHRALALMNITLNGNDEKSFTDEGDISPYALEAVKLLGSNSIMNGMGDNSVKPLNTATRAECIQMLYNLITKIKEA